MYIDKTYPFEVNHFLYFNSLDKCLGTCNLLNHYNNIYCIHVNNLNKLLSKYPHLQNYSLDELIYNHEHIDILEKDMLYKLASATYSHHVFFHSLCDKTYNLSDFEISKEIINTYGSISNFYQEFTSIALSVVGSGYVYLVANEYGKLSIIKMTNYETPIINNLYPLLAIDMWEHSYMLKFNIDKKTYINNFLNVINWPCINNEFLECKKCIM